MKKMLGNVMFYGIGTLVAICAIFLISWAWGWVYPEGYLVKEATAVKALETQGFKDVKIINRNCSFIHLRGGGDRDKVRFTAEATNPAGQKVKVYIFSGWPFKGATVRSL